MANSHNRILEESHENRQFMDQLIWGLTDGFLNSLPSGKAYYGNGASGETPKEWLDIGDTAANLEEILQAIDRYVVHAGINPASGGHLGYIPGGGIYASALGDLIAAVTNRYAGVHYASPGAVDMENALIDWAGQLIGYEAGFGGNLTSGGSMANLIAISAARKQHGIAASNIRNKVIYCSSQTHHSIKKAVIFLGLEECMLRVLPIDDKFRLCLASLREQLAEDTAQGLSPFMVVANAGSTDVGAIDPLEEIRSICTANGAWFHVDAAYGGFFMLTSTGRAKLRGLGSADSVILDPHKGLFLPYGSGIVLVRDINHLLAVNQQHANYMQDARNNNTHSPSDLSPELSKHFRGMRMWLPLKLYGTKAFSDYLDEKLQLTHYLYGKLKETGFEVLCEPDLTVVAFRYDTGDDRQSDTLNKSLLDAILQDGRIFISSTILHGRFTLRAAILSFRTHQREVDLLLQLLQAFLLRPSQPS